ncbi:MAG: hypothetical protein GY806_11320 [Gammaproteobacteria bacterium]|nr:hypothetical protein [Gammaproteobacteria bacterium]
MTKKYIYAFIFFLLPISSYAQMVDSEKTVLYVTDQLRLSLYVEANDQSSVVLYLTSGDSLIVEEVAGPYARVTAPTGKMGWVKRGFLVSEPTASFRLDEMLETNDLLKKELERLNNSKVVLDQYEKDMDAMNSQIETLKQQKQLAEETVDNLISAAKEKDQAEKQRPALASVKKLVITYWQYLAGSAAIILLLGFLIGKSSTESAIRRKFHGIKVW